MSDLPRFDGSTPEGAEFDARIVPEGDTAPAEGASETVAPAPVEEQPAEPAPAGDVPSVESEIHLPEFSKTESDMLAAFDAEVAKLGKVVEGAVASVREDLIVTFKRVHDVLK